MATIGQKKAAAQSPNKYVHKWNEDTVFNEIHADLYNAGQVPVTFEKGEIRNVSPVQPSQSEWFGFQYFEFTYDSKWYGARAMIGTETDVITEKKALTLNLKGATTLGNKIITGFTSGSKKK